MLPGEPVYLRKPVLLQEFSSKKTLQMLLVEYKNGSENIRGLQGHGENMEINAEILLRKWVKTVKKFSSHGKKRFPWYLKDFANYLPDEIYQARQHSVLNRSGLSVQVGTVLFETRHGQSTALPSSVQEAFDSRFSMPFENRPSVTNAHAELPVLWQYQYHREDMNRTNAVPCSSTP